MKVLVGLLGLNLILFLSSRPLKSSCSMQQLLLLCGVVTLWQDLFVAVMAGVLLTAASFAWDIGENIAVEVSESMVKTADGQVQKVKIYQLQGPLFFAVVVPNGLLGCYTSN